MAQKAKATKLPVVMLIAARRPKLQVLIRRKNLESRAFDARFEGDSCSPIKKLKLDNYTADGDRESKTT